MRPSDCPRDDWYIVAESAGLGKGPLSVTLMSTPLVVFRGRDGRVGALLDRCPHRNVPLSLGRVDGSVLECGYHGWRFDVEGVCRVIPGLHGDADMPGRRVPAFAVRESDGFVWVYATPDVEPERGPFRFPLLGEDGYKSVRSEVRAKASVFNTAENALDVPHTAYLHGGLFRTTKRAPNEIEVVVQRWHDRVEAEYIGEPRPSGIAGRFLAPRGGAVIHYDRFFLPSICQVEYRLGNTHFMVSSALTPVGSDDTRLFAVISYRLPLPGWVVTPFLWFIGRRIFAQDATMLAEQTATVDRFGGERFTTTELDILGPQVYRLLRNASRGDREPVDTPVERTVRMTV